jgi:maltose-binding protein MalE
MKKYLALILAALILTSAVTSCSNNASEETTAETNTAETVETAAEAESTEETEEETDDGNIRSWEGLTFDGTEINIVGRTSEDYSIDFYAEEITGEAVNDAVYNRNSKVDNDLDVHVNYINGSDDYTTFFANVRNSVSAADGAYDMVSSYAYYGAALSLEKLYTNLHTLPNVTLSNSWYNQSFVNDMTVNGQLDFIIGDLTLTATDRMFITFFNKDLAEQWIPGINLYDVVYEGKWTIDYLSTLISGIWEDSNGSGELDADDVFGLAYIIGSVPTDGLITSLGVHMTDKDSDGNIYISLYNESSNTAFEKLMDLVYNNAGVGRGMDESFKNGKAVFTMTLANYANSLRDFEPDYGVLPLPKLNEEQEGYYTTSQDAYDIISVPTTCTHMEATGATLEYLSALSQSDVYPAYFETTFQKQYMRSEEDAVMFDLIKSGLEFNFGTFYSNCIGNPVWTFRDSITNSRNFATEYRKSEKLYNKLLDKFLEMMAERSES